MVEEKSYYQSKKQIDEDVIFVDAAKNNMVRFDKLYDKYYKPVFLFIYNRVDSLDTASEITSQTFLKAMINLPKYKPQGLPFASWLFKIARNETNLFFRKQKTERSFYLNLSEEHSLIGDLIPEKQDVDPQTILKPLLESLKTEELELVELRYFEKRSFLEISNILNISENNAKVKVHRILGRLKNNFIKSRSYEIGILFFFINTLLLIL